MTQVICDFTKKVIPNAERNVNYVSILDKNLSMAASDELELRIRKKMKKHSRYSIAEYKKALLGTIQEMCK